MFYLFNVENFNAMMIDLGAVDGSYFENFNTLKSLKLLPLHAEKFVRWNAQILSAHCLRYGLSARLASVVLLWEGEG